MLKTVRCPVTGCLEVAHSAGLLGEHFVYRHFSSQIAVMQEKSEPLTCCDLCGMYIPVGWMIKHQRTQRCNRNTQMRWRTRYVAIAN